MATQGYASGLLHMEIPQKVLRPRRPKGCAFSQGSTALSLYELGSHNGTSVSEAVPSVDKCAWERVFQNVYTTEMDASLTGMTMSFLSNANTRWKEVAAGHLEDSVGDSDPSESGFTRRVGHDPLVLATMRLGVGSEFAVNLPSLWGTDCLSYYTPEAIPCKAGAFSG